MCFLIEPFYLLNYIKSGDSLMNVEYDIKEILTDIKQSFDKIDSRFDKLETKLDKVAENVADLKIDLVRVETELKGEIRVLDEKIGRVETELKGEIKLLDGKVDGIGKRLDQTEFINRGVIVGLVLTILGGFVKLFGLR